jgi:hypothetical protein
MVQSRVHRRVRRIVLASNHTSSLMPNLLHNIMHDLLTLSMPITIHPSFLLRLPPRRVFTLSLRPRKRIRARRLHIRRALGTRNLSRAFNPRDILRLIL